MADGKIYITISDTRGGSGAGVSSDADNTQSTGSKPKALGKFVEKKFFDLVESEARQVVNFAVGNIGNFTGNYQTQNNVQSALSAIDFMMNLGITAGGSFVAFGGGPQGVVAAAVATTISIVSTGINKGMEVQLDQFQTKKLNKNNEIMRQRLGLDGLTDGSRTGGY